MNRCYPLFAGLLLAVATAAPAQTASPEVASVRPFPRNALRGTLVVTAPPDVRLDGAVARLSPGARIRGVDNMLVMSGNVVGRELVVNYTRESHGMLHEVWILTDAEIKEKRASASTGRNFIFGSDDNTPRDDGKTPYNQLPGYNSPR